MKEHLSSQVFHNIITIVIVNWNTKELLSGCLNSIYEQTDNDLLEIIVVDNHSYDGSVEMVKKYFPKVVLIENKTNRGFSYANNQAFEKARGKFISRAVDVAEVATKRFLDGTAGIQDVKIDSEEFKNKEGKEVRVSTIELVLGRK